MRYFITGATGFIGSHMAETLAERPGEVHAIVRADSDADLLYQRGVVVHRGDFTDPGLLFQILPETDVVIHCAAAVGDWGGVRTYRDANVVALRKLLDACKGMPLGRFIHMSCQDVYPVRHHYGTEETEPLPRRHPGGYARSKVEAERLVQQYHHDFGVPAVVLRPGPVYGPRDRRLIPWLVDELRADTLVYPGGNGQRALNTLYVGNLVQAVLLAIDREDAVGQTYNLTDDEYVSKRDFVEALADGLDLPRPSRTTSLWAARLRTRLAETRARLLGARRAPLWNSRRLAFLGYNLDFAIDKAKIELGYWPRFRPEDAMYFTAQWFHRQPQPAA